MSEELNLFDLYDLHLLQNLCNESPNAEASHLQFFQLNQRRSEIVDQCTRNFVLRHNKNHQDSPLICLLQEPYYYKKGFLHGPDQSYDSIYLSHSGKRARAAIWCPKSLNPRPVYQLMTEDIAAAAISFGGSSVLIISIYNPPCNNPSQLLSKIEGNFPSEHLQSTILGGDLNCKSSLWGPSDSKHSEIFEGFLLQNDLSCINPPDHEPTCVTSRGTSHIDATFISSSLSDKISNWKLLPITFLEGLDHRPIKFSLSVPTLPSAHPTSYDFRKLNKDLFKTRLANALPLIQSRWNNFQLNSSHDIDLAIQDLSASIFSTATESCSLKHPTISKSWWTSDLETLQQNLKTSRRRHARIKSLATKHEFLNARTIFPRAIRKAKLNFFKSKAENFSNPWDLYKFLGKKRNPNNGNITLSDEQGNPIVLDPNLNADTLLNRFFPDDNPNQETQHHKHTKSFVNDFLRHPSPKDATPAITIHEVKTAFLSMSPFSSPGPDKIFAALIQWGIDTLGPLLTSLFQSCLNTSCILPECLEGRDSSHHPQI